MPKKSKNKMKLWRKLSPGSNLGRSIKRKEQFESIAFPKLPYELVQKLMNRMDPVTMTLSKYDSKKKGENNEIIETNS